MRAFVKMENGMGQEDVNASGALGGAGARFNAESAAIGAARRGPALAPAGGAADATATAKSLFEMGQRRYAEQRYSDAAQSWGQAAPLKHSASHAFLIS